MRTVLLIAILCLSSQAQAEMARLVAPCQETKRICAFIWPKLKETPGWSQDMRTSYRHGANMQTPEGYTFADAEAVIYANAVPKARRPKTTSLQQFIDEDKSTFLKRDPDLSTSQLTSLSDKSGRRFLIHSFKPKDKGNWEQVAYSEEKDDDGNEYYLVFVLSSRTESGYKNSIGAFHQFIATYE